MEGVENMSCITVSVSCVYREVRTFRLSGPGVVSKLFKFDYIGAIILLSVWVSVMSVLTLITSRNCSVNKVIYLDPKHCLHASLQSVQD